MAKTTLVSAVDGIQDALGPLFEERAYRLHGRTFNRTTEDGLTQVVNFQMGKSPPPGAYDIPGMRPNLYGWFTVNLGVYVPEADRFRDKHKDASWIDEMYCCVRTRLGKASGEVEDVWWPAKVDERVVADLRRRFETGGFPFLDRYATRDRILTEWRDRTETEGLGGRPRIIMAKILAGRGEKDRARELLTLEARASEPRRADHFRELAAQLGLGALDV